MEPLWIWIAGELQVASGVSMWMGFGALVQGRCGRNNIHLDVEPAGLTCEEYEWRG